MGIRIHSERERESGKETERDRARERVGKRKRARGKERERGRAGKRERERERERERDSTFHKFWIHVFAALWIKTIKSSLNPETLRPRLKVLLTLGLHSKI